MRRAGTFIRVEKTSGLPSLKAARAGALQIFAFGARTASTRTSFPTPPARLRPTT
jgi:hypothetical protein